MSVLENVGTAYIPVTLDEAAGQAITVTYQTGSGGTATAGADYTAVTSTTLTFNPGETIAYIPLTITNEVGNVDEVSETVEIELTSVTYGGSANVAQASFTAQGTTQKGTVTIVDDDGGVEFLVKDGTQLELAATGDAAVRMTVMRTGTEASLGSLQTINWATGAATGAGETLATSGADFTAASGTLTFATTTISENLTASETDITIASTSNFAAGGGVVTIRDEDISYTSISGGALQGVVRGINGTTATTHTSGASADVTGVYVDVVTTHDTTSEIAENFALTLSSASSGTIVDATGIGTIIDNDANTVTFGNALTFDGNDRLEVSDAANVSVTGPYTFEAWVNTTKAVSTAVAPASYQGVVSKGEYDYQFGLQDPSGAGTKHDVFFWEDKPATPGASAVTTSAVSLNTWTHIAITNTWNGTAGVHQIYVDGVAAGSAGTASAMVDGAANLVFGASALGGGFADFFQGAIDDIRIWDDVRTVSEINSNKKVALRGDEEGLIGYWKLDNTLFDSAGLGSGDGVANHGAFYNGGSAAAGTFVASTAGDGDPIVLDLDGNGVELVGRDAGARFDVTGDGTTDATGWMGSGEGLLALDVDGDGVINGMSEVFSDAFGSGYSDSLTALTSLDSNADGVIDASDDRFDEIIVWRDGDSDGVSGAGEMSSLSDHAIASIDLSAEATYESSAAGHVDAHGTFVYDDGSVGEYVEVTFAFTDTAIVGATVDAVGDAEPFIVDVSSIPIAVDAVVATETASVLVEEEPETDTGSDTHLADSSSGVAAAPAAAAPTEESPISEIEAEPESALEEEIDGYVVYSTTAVAAVAVIEPASLAA